MTEKIQINLRLQEDTIKKLKEEAKKRNRSLNNFLEVIINQQLLEEQFINDAKKEVIENRKDTFSENIKMTKFTEEIIVTYSRYFKMSYEETLELLIRIADFKLQ